MAQAPAGCLALAVALGALLHGGLGQAPRESHLAAGSSGHPRTKRCSCNSWLDTECIYFCHLDIIWVNTPGHTAPYGLGRAPRRRKRSLNRCECLHSKDSICTTFCQAKPWSVRNLKLPVSTGELGDNPHSSDTKHPQSDLLKALRDLAVSNSQLSRRHYSTQKDGQAVVLPWKKSIWKKKR